MWLGGKLELRKLGCEVPIVFMRLALAALLSFACSHTTAFDFNLDGSLAVMGPSGQCRPSCTSPWLGSLRVETDSFADGVYTGPNLLSFEFVSPTQQLSPAHLLCAGGGFVSGSAEQIGPTYCPAASACRMPCSAAT